MWCSTATTTRAVPRSSRCAGAGHADRRTTGRVRDRRHSRRYGVVVAPTDLPDTLRLSLLDRSRTRVGESHAAAIEGTLARAERAAPGFPHPSPAVITGTVSNDHQVKGPPAP